MRAWRRKSPGSASSATKLYRSRAPPGHLKPMTSLPHIISNSNQVEIAPQVSKDIDAFFNIGHNKFLVYVDHGGAARAVLLGSTNWTSTGLCTQTNNTLVIENRKLAERYLDYWSQPAADTKAAKGDPKALQAAKLRTWDASPKTIALAGDAALQSWFSPNTPGARKAARSARSSSSRSIRVRRRSPTGRPTRCATTNVCSCADA